MVALLLVAFAVGLLLCRLGVQSTVTTTAGFERHRVAAWSERDHVSQGAMVIELHGAGLMEIEHVWVEPEWRLQGVGAGLFDFLRANHPEVTQVTAKVPANLVAVWDALKRRHPNIEFVGTLSPAV